MARSITDVKQATVLLGVNSVLNLVATHEIKKSMIGKSCISLERFWDNASETAEMMVHIGKIVNPNIPLEDLHIAGLFHDCGLPAMSIKFPDYIEVLKESNSTPEKSIIELEEKRYTTNHAVIGYYIASSWGLPKDLCNLVLRHHDNEVLNTQSSGTFEWMYAVLKIADNLIQKSRSHQDSEDWLAVKEDVLSFIGMNHDDYNNIEEDLCEMQC